jgi:hypothetical protein
MNPNVDFARYAKIIPSEHVPALKRGLAQIPDFAWLITKPHPEIERLQGDVLRDFPTVYLDDTGASRSRRFVVMLLNNTCDLPDDRIDFVTVAPLVDFSAFVESQKEKRSAASLHDFAAAIRRNEVTELFYLPPVAGFPAGALVLLHLACSVSSKLYRQVLSSGSRIASFTQTGFYYLLIKLTNHIARAESREAVRLDPAPSQKLSSGRAALQEALMRGQGIWRDFAGFLFRRRKHK